MVLTQYYMYTLLGLHILYILLGQEHQAQKVKERTAGLHEISRLQAWWKVAIGGNIFRSVGYHSPRCLAVCNGVFACYVCMF